MWFKNLQLFKFIEPFTDSVEELEQKLRECCFMPCKASDPISQGFVSPTECDDGPLVYSANGFHLICVQTEEKIVPGTVVKQMLKEKVAEIEKAQGRKVRKTEKDNLKEDIQHFLVMRAFSKITKVYGYIDMVSGYLVIDAGTKNKAEEFNVLLRLALGSLKIELPQVGSLTNLLTHWLKTNQYPAEFTISDRCVLSDPREGGTIRCQRQDLFAEDIQTLIHEGRLVSALTMVWAEQVSFTLKDDLSITSLKFLELVRDQAQDAATETAAERFDADFTIMAGALRQFIKAILQSFEDVK